MCFCDWGDRSLREFVEESDLHIKDGNCQSQATMSRWCLSNTLGYTYRNNYV